jgi:DNA invertase Pin-like site-specific DNA recombinase
LKVELKARQVRVVALDLPTSWAMATGKVDDFTARMFAAINDMMLDMLAACARKDYEDRRRRQMQGQAKAKAEGKYVGRPENKRRNARIAAMLAAGTSYSDVQEATGCSRATVAKIAKRVAGRVGAGHRNDRRRPTGGHRQRYPHRVGFFVGPIIHDSRSRAPIEGRRILNGKSIAPAQGRPETACG